MRPMPLPAFVKIKLHRQGEGEYDENISAPNWPNTKKNKYLSEGNLARTIEKEEREVLEGDEVSLCSSSCASPGFCLTGGDARRT